MRKLPVLLVAALLLAGGNLFANDSKTSDPKKDLIVQIGDLLKDNNFVLEDGDLTAEVLFTLNHKKEIVVISVDTENEVLERFVKSRLNYKHVEVATSNGGNMYTVPVRITKS
jgi:predicted methyltransferase